ncbi:hypothetical protein GCM10009525_47370 [Streptosporangium amethystogenes subsp. fukuiense]
METITLNNGTSTTATRPWSPGSATAVPAERETAMDGSPRPLDRRQVLRGALLLGGTVITATGCGDGTRPASGSVTGPAS